MSAETRSIDPLEATARWTAAVRAGERGRPDRLVDDPWAAASPAPRGWPGSPAARRSVLPIVIRTRYFDDWLRAVAIEGPLRQVVLLGAGLDTRAWRLPWPAGAAVYEVDRAEAGGEDRDPRPGRRRAGLRPSARGGDLAADWGPACRRWLRPRRADGLAGRGDPVLPAGRRDRPRSSRP